MSGTSGAPSAEANRYLVAKYGGTAYAVTGPIKVLFLSVVRTANNGTDTEWSTAAGYTAGTGFSGLTMGAPTNNATGAVTASTNAAQITNAPAGTWAGCKAVDSTGTPKELSYASVTGGSKAVNLGDTVVVPIGSLTDQMG
ncbi:MAG TPA: hypothetical protein VGH54_10640 [Mycobacterium sp.]|jgi:hypothetical protein|uniref:hypothetical protein n=1 Tax=Mycobacterium sp. TaxID=1785 RepID=UPI002F411DD6